MSAPLDPLALPLSGSRLIEASAGTGKTWTIASLYLRLVLGHGDAASGFGRPLSPAQILVVTFTIAATRELSDRIRRRLVEAARCFRGDVSVPADDAMLAGLIAAYDPGAARDHAAWRLAAAAEAMDDAAVVTIDAWVQRMLREHAFESGSVFDETLEPDQEAMRAEAVRDYWRQEIYPLTGDALDEVLAIWPSVVALDADVRRLMPRVEDAEDDGTSLAALRASGAAARRTVLAPLKEGWVERFAQMRAWLNEQKAKKKLGSANLRADWLDGWFAGLNAWARDPDRVEFGISERGMTRLTPAGLRACAKNPDTLDLPPAFQAFAELAIPSGLDESAFAMRMHAARRIKQRVRTLKSRAGIFGFQDQLERLDHALAGPDGERLRRRILEQFPVAMIDEYQDTSPLQYRVFDRLYRTADDDRTTGLFLIGDPKQSIFGFRDADIHSYLRARDATAGRHHVLTKNFRSTTALVDAVNRLFAHAESHPDGAFRFGAGPDRPLPFVEVAARGRDDRFVTAAGPVPAMTIVHDAELTNVDDARHRFAERCAEHIATTLNDSSAGFVAADGRLTRLHPSELAVLVRDKNEAGFVRRALQRRGVASAFLSDQESIFASDEAGDLLLWLRAVADPLDNRRARIAFATSLMGLSVDEMAASLSDDRAFEARVELLKTLNVEWREQGVLSMLRRALHRLGLPARWLGRPDGERTLTNVLHLAEHLQAASARVDGEQALIRWFADKLADDTRRSDEEVVRLESDAELVKVVTIFKAKGLEYPVVYLPFAAATREAKTNANDVAWLPDAGGTRRLVFHMNDEVRERMRHEAAQEDLRLLYVALTRAQHALWIGVAPPKYKNACNFHRSALGYLLAGDEAVDEHGIAPLLQARFGGLASVRLEFVDDASETPRTRLARDEALPPLQDAPIYAATFERDWSIGSFSALVRDLPRMPLAAAILDPAIEEEVLASPPDESAIPTPLSVAARHRFPRGAFAGNFLHDQLEWLAAQRFAIGDPDVRRQLVARCERQGWGPRSDDVVEWLTEVVTTPLAPIGVALDGLPRILPEMEFWFPSASLDTRTVDALCREHLLAGRARPPLPARALAGMVMGFADLVFEVDGRYWVLDYKSNALGAGDRDYTPDALERAMAEHRYDVQGAIYLLALHRLLRQRLGERYEPSRQLGGALYLFMRGVRSPGTGCCVLRPDPAWLDALDDALRADPEAVR